MKMFSSTILVHRCVRARPKSTGDAGPVSSEDTGDAGGVTRSW
jgi:hypothetical protein